MTMDICFGVGHPATEMGARYDKRKGRLFKKIKETKKISMWQVCIKSQLKQTYEIANRDFFSQMTMDICFEKPSSHKNESEIQEGQMSLRSKKPRK